MPATNLTRVASDHLEVSTAEGRQLVNTELDADISARASAAEFGPALAKSGLMTVALDDEGILVRYHPDGPITPLA